MSTASSGRSALPHLTLLGGPLLELRAAGQREALQERSARKIDRLLESHGATARLGSGDQPLAGHRIRPSPGRIQTDRVVGGEHNLGSRQRAAQVCQQVRQVAARFGLGRVGPEQKAELFAGNRAQAGGEAVEQGACLATREGQRLAGTRYDRRAKQRDAQDRLIWLGWGNTRHTAPI
ncbi:MAG TPA: hypothetical protein VFO07_13530 [Roseiflexaceae bacterium]|nr:hypothetical protein [Roseiflexaceae bacterium]